MSKKQNPGKFSREYLDPNNRNVILEPTKESEEKTKFVNLMKAMDPVREIIDKSEPTDRQTEQLFHTVAKPYKVPWQNLLGCTLGQISL